MDQARLTTLEEWEPCHLMHHNHHVCQETVVSQFASEPLDIFEQEIQTETLPKRHVGRPVAKRSARRGESLSRVNPAASLYITHYPEGRHNPHRARDVGEYTHVPPTP
jgi:hypothetical protein